MNTATGVRRMALSIILSVCLVSATTALGDPTLEATYDVDQNLTVGSPSAGVFEGSASVSGGYLHVPWEGNNGVRYGPPATNYFDVTTDVSWGSNTVVGIVKPDYVDTSTRQCLVSVGIKDPYTGNLYASSYGFFLLLSDANAHPKMYLGEYYGNTGTSVLAAPSYWPAIVADKEYFLACSWRDNGDGSLSMTLYQREIGDVAGTTAKFYTAVSTKPGKPRKWNVDSKVCVGFAANGANNAFMLDGGINKLQVYGGTYTPTAADYATLFTTVTTEQAQMPVFSPAGGTFNGEQSVSIACATTGAVIHYTTDGNDPTESSATYSGPIQVAQTMTLKAKAFKTGFIASNTATATFTILTPTLEASYTTDQNLSVGTPSAGVLQGAAAVSGGYLNIPLGGNNGVQYGPPATNYISLTNGTSWGSNTIASIFKLNYVDTSVRQALLSVGIRDIYTGNLYAGAFGLSLMANDASGLPCLTLTDDWGRGGSSTIRALGYWPILVADKDYFLAVSWRHNASGTLDMTLYLREANDLTGSTARFTTITSATPGVPKNWNEFSKICVGYYANGPTNASEMDGAVNKLLMYGGYFAAAQSDYEGLFTAAMSERVEAPAFSPAGGIYNDAQSVTISCATTGAVIRYTTDGNDPTESSPVYSGAILVNQSMTLKAKAWVSGMIPSGVATAAYTILTPTFEATYNTNADLALGTPAAGTLAGAATVSGGYLHVPLGGNNGAQYGPAATNYLNVTTDVSWGSNTVLGVFKPDAVDPNTMQTLLSVGTVDPYTSTLWCADYGMSFVFNDRGEPSMTLVEYWGSTGYSQIRAPSYWPAITAGKEYFLAGSWRDNGNNTLDMTLYLREANDLTGATARYLTYTSTNPGKPRRWNAGSKVCIGYYAYGNDYNYPMNGGVNKVQMYGGVYTGSQSSYESLFSLAMSQRVEAPVFTPAAGTYVGTQSVAITSGTSGAVIHYTLDGSEPTESSATYSGEVTVDHSMTLKAKAFATGSVSSYVSSAAYVTKAAAPTFSPNGGMFAAAQDVTIDCPMAGATIRYTTDGTDPSESNGQEIVAGSTVSVSADTTLKAKAWLAPYDVSDVRTAAFTFPTTLNKPNTLGFSNAIVVDADLSDWAGATWVSLDQVYDAAPSDIAEAYYAAKWGADGSKVYVAVRVKDTAPSLSSSYGAWGQSDAVEIYLHTNGSGPVTYLSTQADAQQYTVGVSSDPNQTVWAVVGGQAMPSQIGFEAAGRVGTGADAGWLVYEVAMTPYEYFSLTGQGLVVSPLVADQVIGLDVVAVGHDGTAYTGMKAENMLVGKYNDYSKFGLHKLVNRTPGDANGDGKVNFSDYLVLSQNFGATEVTFEQGDFNEDGTVNFSDYLILSQNFGTGGSVSADEVAKFKAASANLADEAQSQTAVEDAAATLPCTPLAMAVLVAIGLAFGLLNSLKIED